LRTVRQTHAERAKRTFLNCIPNRFSCHSANITVQMADAMVCSAPCNQGRFPVR
jgi:hypothetical protein